MTAEIAARHARASYISFRFPSGLSPTRLRSSNLRVYIGPARRNAPSSSRAYLRPRIRTRRHVFCAETFCRWYFDVRETGRSRNAMCVISRKMVSPARRSVACRRSCPQRRSRPVTRQNHTFHTLKNHISLRSQCSY